MGKSGLTHRQFTVLLAVDSNDGKSQTDLVKVTGIDRSTLADLVARLLAQGYLQRRRTKDDGRTNAIRITAIGKKMLKTALPGADEVDRQLLPLAGRGPQGLPDNLRSSPPRWTGSRRRNREASRKFRPRKGALAQGSGFWPFRFPARIRDQMRAMAGRSI